MTFLKYLFIVSPLHSLEGIQETFRVYYFLALKSIFLNGRKHVIVKSFISSLCSEIKKINTHSLGRYYNIFSTYVLLQSYLKFMALC